MRIVKRTLPPEEVHRAIEAGGPLRDLQVDPDRLATMSIAVVEVDDQIAAYWIVWYALHCEPLWIAPIWRKHPAVVGGIVEQMRTIVEASGDPVAYVEVADENLAVMETYVTRLGFQRAPGVLFYLVTQPAVPPVGV